MRSPCCYFLPYSYGMPFDPYNMVKMDSMKTMKIDLVFCPCAEDSEGQTCAAAPVPAVMGRASWFQKLLQQRGEQWSCLYQKQTPP